MNQNRKCLYTHIFISKTKIVLGKKFRLPRILKEFTTFSTKKYTNITTLKTKDMEKIWSLLILITF